MTPPLFPSTGGPTFDMQPHHGIPLPLHRRVWCSKSVETLGCSVCRKACLCATHVASITHTYPSKHDNTQHYPHGLHRRGCHPSFCATPNPLVERLRVQGRSTLGDLHTGKRLRSGEAGEGSLSDSEGDQMGKVTIHRGTMLFGQRRESYSGALPMGCVIYPPSGHLFERSHADEGNTMPVEREAPRQNGDFFSQDACPWSSIALNWWVPSSLLGTMLCTNMVHVGLCWIGLGHGSMLLFMTNCPHTPPPLVQATVNDQKLTKPTLSVAWP